MLSVMVRTYGGAVVGNRDDGVGDGNATSALGHVEGKTDSLRED